MICGRRIGEKEEVGGTELEQDTRSKSSRYLVYVALFCISQLHIIFYALFIGQFNFLRLLISRALFRDDLTWAHLSLPVVNSFVIFPILDLALPSPPSLVVDCDAQRDEYLDCSR